MLTVDERVSRRRVEKLAEELRYVSTDTFLHGLGLNSKAKEAVSFLKARVPKSKGATTNEFGSHLRDGFIAKAFQTGSKIGFLITHRLAGNDRAMTVIESLDKGTQGHDVVFDEAVSFVDARKTGGKKRGKSGKLPWITLAADVVYHYSPRPAHDFLDETEAYIRATILPEVAADFSAKVNARMARVKQS